jgi:tetratricopeptide (TPR) repeat protein
MRSGREDALHCLKRDVRRGDMKELVCPIPACRAENDGAADVCAECGTPLRAYRDLALLPAQLFNRGLVAARKGQTRRARDLFAAVVYWCPDDKEARNALAMACFALKDYAEARSHWEKVLMQSSQDNTALQGMKELEKYGRSKGMMKHNKYMKRHKKKFRSAPF